ncbi:DUF2505 domain-containing protein [Cellulomonas alba]|uniref:DUF2505 domain-containing protein n=1 Tax=Cellulomonas alba TaxID=3053467 RepID=A0ABT7SCZ8_9CELL|nr:DUF2505 domain-containing protein [Cellulomonas alba]MDM7854062.1 DUF2505 domain-containing protein [Cellulomonas alba]
MHVHETLDLPTDAQRVARLLADPGLAQAVADRLGAVAHTTEVTGSPDGSFAVTSRLTLPSDSVPSHLRAMVGPRIEVRQVESWQAPSPDGSREGTVAIEFPGAPVRVTGRTALRATGPAGCTLERDGDVRASVPLFGATVEQAAAGALRRALEAHGAELHERATQP